MMMESDADADTNIIGIYGGQLNRTHFGLTLFTFALVFGYHDYCGQSPLEIDNRNGLAPPMKTCVCVSAYPSKGFNGRRLARL